MKRKMKGVLGVALAFVVVASLMVFALPVSADPYAPLDPPLPNIWSGYPPTPGAAGGWFFDPAITRVGPMAQAINGDLYVYVEGAPAPAVTTGDIFKSTDGGRTWTVSPLPLAAVVTKAAAGRYTNSPGPGARVVDMVCSDVYEDVLYVTDGDYVYKSVDGAMTFSYIAPDDLEYNLRGKCGLAITGLPITSIDVGYDGGGEPIIFIGTKRVPGRIYVAPHPDVGLPVVGSVYWISDEVFPAEWHDLQLRCYSCCDITVAAGGCYDVFAVGVAPDFATSNKIYAVVTTPDDNCLAAGVTPSTRVVSSIGTTCSWNFVSELCWDCVDDAAHSFEISHASRIVFPMYYGTNPTLFVGVVGAGVHGPGGDVYRVSDTIPPSPIALDLNVQGFTTGCIGLRHANICSLDIKNDSLIAGAYDGYEQQLPTTVYYSYDGGWVWAASKKPPTGMGLTYVLWVGNSALAATYGCECAVSMSCGANVGEFWNQISLISTAIDEVLDLSHAPGYLDGSSTMFALTVDYDSCNGDDIYSLFRWDGTYCERVYNSRYATWGFPHWVWDSMDIDWVEVSPDFNTTGCVYMANIEFFMFRTLDAGCSWAPLTYPCEPRPHISAWIVVDLETVLAAGGGAWAGNIYRTTYHGAQPWENFLCQNSAGVMACHGVDFDLSLPRSADSDVLFGDQCGQVYLSEDLGATWNEIKDAVAPIFPARMDTYVVFDPGYGTADDPGEEMVYAAAGNVIGRCDIDFGALWTKQDWVVISLPTTIAHASGIDAAGDTALYVSDYGSGDGPTPLTVSGTIAVEYVCGFGRCTCDITVGPVTLIELSEEHFIDGEPVVIVTYDLYCDGPDEFEGTIVIMGLISGAIGGTSFVNVDISPPCPPCYNAAAFEVISSVLVVSGGVGAVGPIPSGVVRSLNPMDPVPPAFPLHLVVFERLVNAPTMPAGPTALRHPEAGPLSAYVYPDDLWLTAGSNVLWALDEDNNTTIWIWDDPLAAPVIQVAPADGAALVTPYGVTLEWEALDAAALYEVYIYSYCPACPDQKNLEYTITTMETCLVVGAPNHPLLPGTKYFWKVRVALSSPFLSKWSDLREFTTALGPIPNLCSPECGGDDIIPTTNFSWDEVMGATGYELQIAAAGADGTADFTGAATLATSVNALASIPGLDYSTTYYWRVRAVMDGVPGAWSVCIFTTMAEPEEPVEPITPVTIVTEEITPVWIWVIIGIGAALVITVIVLIVSTRRVS